VLTNPTNLIDADVTCADYKQQGLDGLIHPSDCNSVEEIEEINSICGCSGMAFQTEVSPSANTAAATTTSAATAESTGAGSATAAATAAAAATTAASTNGGYPACDICGDSSSVLTNPTNLIDADVTCADYKQQGLDGLIHPSDCNSVEEIEEINSICGCSGMAFQTEEGTTASDVASSSTSATATAAAATTTVAAATTTASVVVISSSSGDHPPCHVCGVSKEVEHKDQPIEDGVSCRDYELQGLAGQIPPNLCRMPELVELVEDTCHCISKSDQRRQLRLRGGGNAV